MKIDSDDGLPLGKRLNMHNIVILIKSLFNVNYDYYYHHYYCQVFLEKCLYKLTK